MADELNSSKVTKQGFGFPVSVGVGGERAGPSRPLASDCLAPAVGDQAGVREIMTGTAVADGSTVGFDPFGRGGLVGHSPPINRRGSFGTQSEKEYTGRNRPERKEGLTQRMRAFSGTFKRPREETTGSEMDEFKQLMRELTEISADLVQAININVNTKMDIKKGVRKVNWLVDSLNRRMEGWNDLPLKVKPRVAESKATRTVAVQVESDDIENEGEKLKSGDREEVIGALSLESDFSNLARVID